MPGAPRNTATTMPAPTALLSMNTITSGRWVSTGSENEPSLAAAASDRRGWVGTATAQLRWERVEGA